MMFVSVFLDRAEKILEKIEKAMSKQAIRDMDETIIKSN